jgi:hypothetical protein
MAIHFYSQNAGLNIDDILCRTIDPIITKCGVFKNSQRCISVDHLYIYLLPNNQINQTV